MTIPPYLKPGDKIALVAPARKISVAELQPAVDLLVSKGFVPVWGQHVLGSFNQFSGTDRERISDFQAALDDKEIKAIIAVRGGYGCMRIVDQLDFTGFKQSPKWLVGYSDMTVFHSHVVQKTNVCTLHATMPVNFFKSPEATQTLFDALTGKTLSYTFAADGVYGSSQVKAPLAGGNLSLLYAMQGSASDIDTNGKILFLEDLDEYLYHIDRMMLSLKRAGKLSGLKALLIGGFTEMKDNTVPFGATAHEIILDAVKEYGYPVFFNFPAGHQDHNCAVKMGCEASITLEGKQVLFIQE